VYVAKRPKIEQMLMMAAKSTQLALAKVVILVFMPQHGTFTSQQRFMRTHSIIIIQSSSTPHANCITACCYVYIMMANLIIFNTNYGSIHIDCIFLSKCINSDT
jgi:hypothetical protein